MLAEHDHPWPIRGPFFVWSNTSAIRFAVAAVPLYRCKGNFPGTASHFVSTHTNCEGIGTMEKLLGFMSARRDSAAPRVLRRCGQSTSDSETLFYTVVDGPCLRVGDIVQELGYVV